MNPEPVTPAFTTTRPSDPADFHPDVHFLPYQVRWINDPSRLKIIEKSRQIGLTYADAFDSVLKAGGVHGYYDVWFTTRDETTAARYIDLCKDWARYLHLKAEYLGYRLIDAEKDLRAHDLKFATGLHIFSLSSSPDALVGKWGHIKLDEFAIHRDGGQLFRIAKPGTQWGGHLSIISTHRSETSAFNQFIRDIAERGNPMGWSHHKVTLHEAVAKGLVERINRFSGRDETREAFLARTRRECIDEQQWAQEYCCVPGSDRAAFLSQQLLTSCEEAGCLRPFAYLVSPSDSELSTLDSQLPAFYVGVDVARRHDLCVIDVGELHGDVMWDRLRIELRDQPFSVIESELFRILALPRVQRCCIDATGIGMQLAERAGERFGWKVEPITFTDTIKERLAFDLRRAFEDRRLRIVPDPELRADLRGVRKTVTDAGHIRFAGESDDSHCDRFWAKALRQHAATKPRDEVGGAVL